MLHIATLPELLSTFVAALRRRCYFDQPKALGKVRFMLLPAMLFVAHLGLSGRSGDTEQDVSKGAALLRGCQAELRLMQPDALTTAPQGDLVSGSYCVGYLNGFLANLPERQSSICVDAQPVVALVNAYVQYMERNPGLREQDKRIGLRQALQEAFPCPAVSGTPAPQASSRRDRL